MTTNNTQSPVGKHSTPVTSTISVCPQFDQSFATLYRSRKSTQRRKGHVLADICMVTAWFALIPVINLLGSAAGLH